MAAAACGDGTLAARCKTLRMGWLMHMALRVLIILFQAMLMLRFDQPANE